MISKSGTRRVMSFVVVAAIAFALSGCALFEKSVDNLLSKMRGRSATIMTFNVHGQMLDRVHGSAIDIKRDGTFDTTNPDGSTNADSSVIQISVGKSTMNHVGSTLLMVEDGVVNVSDQLPAKVDIQNMERGVPFLNYIWQNFRNVWQGKGRTIIVRSQNGSPIAIFAGNAVEYFATDIPKSTLLRIDGKYLLIYRSDYTMYDNSLLG